MFGLVERVLASLDSSSASDSDSDSEFEVLTAGVKPSRFALLSADEGIVAAGRLCGSGFLGNRASKSMPKLGTAGGANGRDLVALWLLG